MKNFYFITCILLSVIGLSVQAQTIKNIHRHNQPVFNIPVELIDKVETVDSSGTRSLVITPFLGEITQIPLSEIDSITHYVGSLNPEQLGEIRTASVMGIVRDNGNTPINMAVVRSIYGGEETHTDANGVFFLNDILVYDKLGYVSVTKPGFHQGSRSFLPLENGSNRVNVQLLPMIQSGTFNAASGGTVTSGLLQLNFPSNAIVLNGQPYSGTVSVYAQSLDPTSTEMYDQMPGELLGGMNDSLRLLRSFGMAAVELRDANMNELQLAEGETCSLTFNIPSSLQAEAPATIDWWSFDEILGYWKHEGEAQKQGSQYVGLASHFSWWNCDLPQNFNDFHGTVNTEDGNPIADALVNVVTTTIGTGSAYTNTEGEFSGRVPKNQNLTLNIYLTCNTTNDWTLAHTEVIQSNTVPIESVVIANLDNHYPITGTLLNCQGLPVESGYVKLGAQIFMAENGAFIIQTCQIGNYSIRGYNTTDPDSIRLSDVINVLVENTGANVGNIPTCLAFYSTVADLSGNVYQTVVIGTQTWMAENLRSSSYANGDEILGDSSNNWSSLSAGAWMYYEDNDQYGDLYGKLYNPLAVTDPRNVCPAGWHVPSDSEWLILTEFLGGENVAGDKMKTTSGWEAPYTTATNESGFSGLPGGDYVGFIGFVGIHNEGAWWSNEGTNIYLLNSNSSNFSFQPDPGIFESSGFSVRCLKNN